MPCCVLRAVKSQVCSYQALSHCWFCCPQRHFWGFDGSSLDVVSVDRPLPEDQLLLQFLATLTQLCCVRESVEAHTVIRCMLRFCSFGHVLVSKASVVWCMPSAGACHLLVHATALLAGSCVSKPDVTSWCVPSPGACHLLVHATALFVWSCVSLQTRCHLLVHVISWCMLQLC